MLLFITGKEAQKVLCNMCLFQKIHEMALCDYIKGVSCDNYVYSYQQREIFCYHHKSKFLRQHGQEQQKVRLLKSLQNVLQM